MVIAYGAVTWFGPLLSFLLFPIITRILNVGDYGIADVILTISSGIATLATFAQPQALAAHFNDQSDERWQQNITSSTLANGLLMSLPTAILLMTLAPWIVQASFGNQDYVRLFQAIGLGLCFGSCAAILVASAQSALRVRWGMVLSIVTILFNTGSNLLLIVVLRVGMAGLVLTPILTSIAVTVTGLILLRQRIGRPSVGLMKQLLLSGAILLPTLSSGWVLQMADRLFLLSYLSTDVANSMGYYATANRIASLLGVVMAPLYAAWTPLALATAEQADFKIRQAAVARYLVAIVLVASLGLGIFATEILLVLSRRSYLPAAPYIGYLTYVHVFSAFGTVLSTGALAAKQLKAISATVIMGALINILLNFMLIPPFGVWGATIATVLSYALPQVVLYLWLHWRYPIPYPVWTLTGALAVQALLLLLSQTLPPLAFPLRITIKFFLFSLLPIAFVLLKVITRFELQQSWLFVRNQVRIRLGAI